MGSPAAPRTNPGARYRDPGRRQAAPGENPVEDYAGTLGAGRTRTPGEHNAAGTRNPAGTPRQPGRCHARSNPARPAITTRNILPDSNTSHFDQRQDGFHDR